MHVLRGTYYYYYRHLHLHLIPRWHSFEASNQHAHLHPVYVRTRYICEGMRTHMCDGNDAATCHLPVIMKLWLPEPSTADYGLCCQDQPSFAAMRLFTSPCMRIVFCCKPLPRPSHAILPKCKNGQASQPLQPQGMPSTCSQGDQVHADARSQTIETGGGRALCSPACVLEPPLGFCSEYDLP